MPMGRVLVTCLGISVCCAGCASHKCKPAEPAKVTVRFLAPSDGEAYAEAHAKCQAQLVGYHPWQPCDEASGRTNATTEQVVLWGGEFNGNNVTQEAVSLAPGSYRFTFSDPDAGAAYQGWIEINSGGDDLASAMAEWRETIHAEQEWTAFESKLEGKFSSHNPNDFNEFRKELRSLKNLEAKIDRAAQDETREQEYWGGESFAALSGAQVLLMPGDANMFTPCTGPAFNAGELTQAQSGQAVTKVVLAGDYAHTMEKLRRVTEMQGDLTRFRAVWNEQVRRFENRGRYFRLTDHLYHHGDRFIENERNLQAALGHVARLDEQLAANGRRANALLFVAGLFDPDGAMKAFEQQQAAMQREQTVLEAQKNRLDRMFANADEMGEQRIAIERQRQNIVADLEQINARRQDTEQSRLAVAELRKSTNVIHRQGPTCVLATSFVADGLPARVVDAISRESLMTVRLEAMSSGAPQSGSVTDQSNFQSEQKAEYMLTSHSGN